MRQWGGDKARAFQGGAGRSDLASGGRTWAGGVALNTVAVTNGVWGGGRVVHRGIGRTDVASKAADVVAVQSGVYYQWASMGRRGAITNNRLG